MAATFGMSPTNLANKWLNILNGTAFASVPAALYWALHNNTSAPGAAGNEGQSIGSTTRSGPVAYTAAAGGAMSQTGTQPNWTNTSVAGSPPGQETLAGISSWDAATAGNFLYSFALSATQVWQDTNTFNMTTWNWGLTPIATG